MAKLPNGRNTSENFNRLSRVQRYIRQTDKQTKKRATSYSSRSLKIKKVIGTIDYRHTDFLAICC